MATAKYWLTVQNPIRCRWDMPPYILAISYFLYWFGMGGIAIVSVGEFLKHFFFFPVHAPNGPFHEAVLVIAFSLAFILFWRLPLCLKPDIKRVVMAMGGTFLAEKRLAKGLVGKVGYEIRFDRPFFDYWPHPRGVDVQIGGYNPKYMRRLSEIRLRVDLEKPLSRRVRLCPGNSENEIIDDTLAVTGQWRHAFEESFGNEPGDWELELEQNRLSALIRSGTWEGTTFAGKVRKGIELMHQMADDLASIGHLETN
ncbi:hypothetical protein [Desulfurivibrio dismutans]|uniref:hypothetical protein n=1 Tax=Desulfurivibrio dismutans TaxID=1398908 RepID=UPI0023DB4E15|nr:hypothetical protein [Desulfurivibrio alkaliphilus]MDF1613700.1 hypothetical protein [Desulfurivibrio alkaliphilus]